MELFHGDFAVGNWGDLSVGYPDATSGQQTLGWTPL